MTDIDAFLEKFGVPRSLVVRSDDASGWIVPFALQGYSMCDAAGAEFAFVESTKMQAAAVQAETGRSAVGVYVGMFWMLCRLSAVVARSGVFPGMKGDIEAEWDPDLLRSLQVPRELLEEGKPFDWEIESLGWKRAPERQMLFYLVLTVLFRFVVFHELGHIRNDHGRRRLMAKGSAMMVDRLGPKLISPKDAIPSQAREIIADGSAIQMTIQSLRNEFALKEDLEMTRVIRDRLIGDDEALIGFVLTVVHMYFRLSDRSDWESLPIDQLSHPPAPFRMKALFALLVEVRPLGISEETAIKIVQRSLAGGDAVMSVMLNVFPNPNWMKTIATPVHDAHFLRLYDEFPAWAGKIATS